MVVFHLLVGWNRPQKQKFFGAGVLASENWVTRDSKCMDFWELVEGVFFVVGSEELNRSG